MREEEKKRKTSRQMEKDKNQRKTKEGGEEDPVAQTLEVMIDTRYLT